MAWISKPKVISIGQVTPHFTRQNGVSGRAPATTSITFTPAELFGAAARCSHLHVINPALTSPERQMMAALIEEHVDDTSSDFAILPTAQRFKDFVGGYFTGSVAAGIAYLALINDGYTWSDHFENVVGGNPAVSRSPDFVFARTNLSGVALLESKGTRRATKKSFDKRVRDGYIDQVEPHLGHPVGNFIASHGCCVGSWLTSPTKGELYVHHTDTVPAMPVTPSRPTDVARVQQNNYATAFQLAHSSSLAEQVRSGRIEAREIGFMEFNWLGQKWLTAPDGLWSRTGSLIQVLFGPYVGSRPPGLADIVRAHRGFGFAVEKKSAVAVLEALSRPERAITDGFDLRRISDDLILGARHGEVQAAVFPDGLAVSADIRIVHDPRLWLWQRG
jgi:hypothetical protein